MDKKVLHIVNWFPTKQYPKNALWVKNHLNALHVDFANDVLHVEVKKGSVLNSRFGSRELLGNRAYLIYLPFEQWKLYELITGVILFWHLRIRSLQRRYDLINFHIAYPLLYFGRRILRKCIPLVVTEHWSAYYFHFNLPEQSPKLNGIRRIFHHQYSVIAVSRSLLNDIQDFSGANFSGFVVPNVVDTDVFKYRDVNRKKQFFILSNWKHPKDPFSVLKVFSEFSNDYPDYHLRIGGHGPQLEAMDTLVKQLNIEGKVEFLGTLDELQIAREFNESGAFIHLSAYETFSVVCAESICCGCPVIASRVGGIPEFIDKSNGVLVEVNNLGKEHLKMMIQHPFNREEISKQAQKKFSLETVGSVYQKAFTQIIESHES